MAAITGLAALKRHCQVTLYSDSRYLVDAMVKGWAQAWQAKGWTRGRREPVKNVDLWQELLRWPDPTRVSGFGWRGTRGMS